MSLSGKVGKQSRDLGNEEYDIIPISPMWSLSDAFRV